MRKKTLKRASLVALAGTMLQFGGCLDLQGFWKQAMIGFARGVGELPVAVVNDLFISDLLSTLVPDDGA